MATPSIQYPCLPGQRFGRLIVLSETSRPSFDKSNGHSKLRLWVCRCDCGTEISVRPAMLRRGDTSSCGCWARERSQITLAARFWACIDKNGLNGCWRWLNKKTKAGYGRISVNGQQVLAHRISWILAGNDLPDDLQVLHKCDNPECCNPEHLFVGTHQDNMADRDAKGRTARVLGSARASAKLVEAQVQEIRVCYAAGEATQKELAARYQVSRATISFIVNGKCWSHLGAENYDRKNLPNPVDPEPREIPRSFQQSTLDFAQDED